MTPATRFKFLIVNYIEQYAPLDRRRPAGFRHRLREHHQRPGRIHPAHQRQHATSSCARGGNRTSIRHPSHARIL